MTEVSYDEIYKRAINFLESHRAGVILIQNGGNIVSKTVFYVTESPKIFFLVKSDSDLEKVIAKKDQLTMFIYDYSTERKFLHEFMLKGEVTKLKKDKLKGIFDKYETFFPQQIEDDDSYLYYEGKDAKGYFYQLDPSVGKYTNTEQSIEDEKLDF